MIWLNIVFGRCHPPSFSNEISIKHPSEWTMFYESKLNPCQQITSWSSDHTCRTCSDCHLCHLFGNICDSYVATLIKIFIEQALGHVVIGTADGKENLPEMIQNRDTWCVLNLSNACLKFAQQNCFEYDVCHPLLMCHWNFFAFRVSLPS